MAGSAYLEAGKIVNTHGVKGDVKIECWCDSPEVMASLPTLYFKQGGEYLPQKLGRRSPFKGMVLCHFTGVESFEDANLLRGRIVYAAREDIPLPEGAVFMADLMGLPVIDADTGKQYGVIRNVQEGMASDLYEIDTGKETVLFPAVKEFVKQIDLEKGVFIRPIGGFFDAV